MQMCRWFGYRPSYKDLCKVYLPEESISWYAFISSTIKELYSELELMADRQERPKDFGLKVREHPGAMLITAKNKIGWGRSQTISQDLWGQTQRRFEFYDDPLRNATNVDYTKIFIEDLFAQQGSEIKTDKISGSILISDVSYQNIIDYVKAIDLPEDDLGNVALIRQLIAMNEAGMSKPKVLLFNQNASASPQWFKDLSTQDKEFLDTPYTVAGRKIILPRRAMSLEQGRFRVRSVHLGNSDDERLFLSSVHQEHIREGKSPIKPVDHDYIASEHRDFAGLKIYFFGISQRRKLGDVAPPNLIHGHEATLGYTLSFPRSEKLRGQKTPKEIRALIKTTRHSYFLNKIHAKNKDLGAYEDMEHE
jgi:hypothetical protein